MPDDKPPPTPVPPDLAEAIARVADEVRDHPDALRKVEYLLDALILRGQLPDSLRRVVSKIRADREPKVRLATFTDKYEAHSPDIDCAARIPLCGARCCTFEVTLSAQDVAEKIVPFELEKPYVLPRDPATGRCTCMDARGACTIYAHRPATCRTYDCREDARVWVDFEARIPAKR